MGSWVILCCLFSALPLYLQIDAVAQRLGTRFSGSTGAPLSPTSPLLAPHRSAEMKGERTLRTIQTAMSEPFGKSATWPQPLASYRLGNIHFF